MLYGCLIQETVDDFFINENNTDDTSNDEGAKYFAVSLRQLHR